MDAEERESASSLRQKILAPHVAKRQLLSLVTNNPLPSAEKLSMGTDILKYPSPCPDQKFNFRMRNGWF